MGRKPYSNDLRGLVVEEVAAGSSRRAAARRFKVSVSSAIRWVGLHGETGSVSRRVGGKRRSPLEAHAPWLLALIAGEPALTLAEIVQRVLAELGLHTTDSSVDRFFDRHGISFKKKPARRRTGPVGRGTGARELEGRPGKT